MLDGEPERDRPAERVAEHVGALETETLDQRGNVARQQLGRSGRSISPVRPWPCRSTVITRRPAGQRGQHRGEDLAARDAAVQQHERLAGAVLLVVQREPVDLGVRQVRDRTAMPIVTVQQSPRADRAEAQPRRGHHAGVRRRLRRHARAGPGLHPRGRPRELGQGRSPRRRPLRLSSAGRGLRCRCRDRGRGALTLAAAAVVAAVPLLRRGRRGRSGGLGIVGGRERGRSEGKAPGDHQARREGEATAPPPRRRAGAPRGSRTRHRRIGPLRRIVLLSAGRRAAPARRARPRRRRR